MEQPLTRARAQALLDAFSGRRILVLGDVMLDEYIWGKVGRISPEAPVMVVDADHETHVPGGAANVVNNLCALGAAASIVGVVGDDGAGSTLREKLHDEGADTSGLVTTPDRPTTRKTRVMAHSQHDNRQQIVRVDHERRDPVDADTQARLRAVLQAALPGCDALLLSDYQKGLLGASLLENAITQARALGEVITGNLKPPAIGPHARLTVLTLNVSEASAATGLILDNHTDEGTLREAGRMLRRRSGSEHVLITRGAQGLTLFGPQDSQATVPAHPVEVFDGAGAGDTVISTLTLALAAGAAPLEAVRLANYAGAMAVRKVGVATVTRAEILAALSEDAQ